MSLRDQIIAKQKEIIEAVKIKQQAEDQKKVLWDKNHTHNNQSELTGISLDENVFKAIVEKTDEKFFSLKKENTSEQKSDISDLCKEEGVTFTSDNSAIIKECTPLNPYADVRTFPVVQGCRITNAMKECIFLGETYNAMTQSYLVGEEVKDSCTAKEELLNFQLGKC